jgi:hypothetical protein
MGYRIARDDIKRLWQSPGTALADSLPVKHRALEDALLSIAPSKLALNAHLHYPDVATLRDASAGAMLKDKP